MLGAEGTDGTKSKRNSRGIISLLSHFCSDQEFTNRPNSLPEQNQNTFFDIVKRLITLEHETEMTVECQTVLSKCTDVVSLQSFVDAVEELAKDKTEKMTMATLTFVCVRAAHIKKDSRQRLSPSIGLLISNLKKLLQEAGPAEISSQMIASLRRLVEISIPSEHSEIISVLKHVMQPFPLRSQVLEALYLVRVAMSVNLNRSFRPKLTLCKLQDWTAYDPSDLVDHQLDSIFGKPYRRKAVVPHHQYLHCDGGKFAAVHHVLSIVDHIICFEVLRY